MTIQLALFTAGWSLFTLLIYGAVPVQSCTDGDVQLVNGRSRYEGRVEFCHEGQWGTVCDDFWGAEDASTVCRQLNLSQNNSKAIAVPQAFFGEGTGDIVLDNVQCTAEDTRLGDCSHRGFNNHDCGHFEDAGVICQGSSDCSDGDVRLAGGDSEWEGRLEVCLSRVWGTVCDINWDIRDATTVCRQLIGNRQTATLVRASILRVNAGKGPIFFKRVNCNYTSSRLMDCPKQTDINYHRACTHLDDAGVQCEVRRANVTKSVGIRNTKQLASKASQYFVTPTSIASTILPHSTNSIIHTTGCSMLCSRMIEESTAPNQEGTNRSSPPPFPTIFGALGAALLFVIVSVLAVGILALVIGRRGRKDKGRLQEHTSSLQEGFALDNPVYGSTNIFSHENRALLPDSVETTNNDSVDGCEIHQNLSADYVDQQMYETVQSTPENDMERDTSLYETPQPRGFTRQEGDESHNVTNGNYSRLNVSDVRYATLEPFIPGKKDSVETESATSDGVYSVLRH